MQALTGLKINDFDLIQGTPKIKLIKMIDSTLTFGALTYSTPQKKSERQICIYVYIYIYIYLYMLIVVYGSPPPPQGPPEREGMYHLPSVVLNAFKDMLRKHCNFQCFMHILLVVF